MYIIFYYIKLFRLLLRKIKREIEQAQLKLNELHNIFDLSLNVHTQLLSQYTENNTKVSW